MIARQIDGGIAFFAVGWKVEHAPVDSDFAVAHTEKSAKIDDGGTHPASMIGNDINDPSHAFTCRTDDILAKDTFELLCINDCCRRTFIFPG